MWKRAVVISRRRMFCLALAGLTLTAPLGAQDAPAPSPDLVAGSLTSELVPGPIEYYALLPPGYAEGSEPLPLVLNLHGGGGSREVLARQAPSLRELWQAGEIHPMVIVTPSVTARGFYMDFRDGSEKWETFILGPFLAHLRERFRVRSDRDGTFVTGISMGGMGSLRLAFKHPELFAAVAGMEPGIEPILEWREMRPKHRFWRSDELLERAYGKPIDELYWAANNPATIATRNAESIRASGLKIFLDAGDQDMFWLYEGTEFLHQALWSQRIRHEYRLYYGADHVGRSLTPRTAEAYRFLSRTLDPPEPDPQLDAASARIDPLKRDLEEADHYGVDAHLVRGGKDGQP